jgi:hypothetical protein
VDLMTKISTGPAPWMNAEERGWYGVDLDGTLVEYHDDWLPWNVFGRPIPAMVTRVKLWLLQGKEVRIMTARVFPHIHGATGYTPPKTCLVTGHRFTIPDMISAIQDLTQDIVGQRLPCTCAKDYKMLEQWDDRAVQVIPNTGKTLFEENAAIKSALAGKADPWIR